MSKLNDLTGQRFGRLTVLARADDYVSSSGRHRVMWQCQCDCGKQIIAIGNNLTRGKTTSCGCYRRDVAIQSHLTHGESNTKLYGVWLAMRNRCNNPSVDAYPDYGGRGIKVCDEWNDNFQTFRDWAYASGYAPDKDGHDCSIDRIDTNGDYEPSNCRWIGGVAQANNRRSNRLYTYSGVTHNIKEWADLYGLPYQRLHQRLKAGWSIEKALTT